MTSHASGNIPNTPQDIEKRNFLKQMCVVVGGVMGFFLTWPFVSSLIPMPKLGGDTTFSKVPNFKSIPASQPTIMTFEYLDQDAFISHNAFYDIWVIKHSDTEATIYSPLCPHLNCRYDWEAPHFNCPCHGSVFDETGKVLGGPSPRPLDTLPYKIEGGELFVNWKQYKAAIPEKVEA